jgi:hypothetical protein
MKQFFSLWPLTAVLVSLSANGTGPDGAAIVALAKAATGGQEWDRIEVWHEVGRFRLACRIRTMSTGPILIP